MPKNPTVTFTMGDADPKKHSVRFNGDEKDPLQSVYVSRDAAKKAGIKDLDDVEEIEVTITFKTQGGGKKKKSRDDDDDDEDED